MQAVIHHDEVRLLEDGSTELEEHHLTGTKALKALLKVGLKTVRSGVANVLKEVDRL